MVTTSIIIVNYNGKHVLEDCLHALEVQSDRDFEVILVDNASKDESISMVQEQFPWVRIVELQENSGFAGGNIRGLHAAIGKYICLLNPDTVPHKEWLERITDAMDAQPQVGICASKLLLHGTSLIDSAGDGCIVTGRGYKRGEGESQEFFTTSELVFGACGGAMLIRRQLIEHIGFLDEDFFLIYEDTDYCFRAQLAGWKCLYVADAIVWHKLRTTIGTLSDFAVYYSIRNSRYVWLKNMPRKLIFKHLISIIIQELGSFIYFCIKHGKWSQYWKANKDFLIGIPKCLSKRSVIMQKRIASDSDIEALLTPLFSANMVQKKLNKIFARNM